jgi:hypothetical protein
MNGSGHFKQMQVLHTAMMVGVVMVAVILGGIISTEGTVTDYNGFVTGLLGIAAILMAAVLTVSQLIWNKRQGEIPNLKTADEKWMHYRSASIVRWAMIEGSIFFAICMVFVEKNLAGYLLVAVGLAFLYLARPNRDYAAEKYGFRDLY